VDVTEPGTPEEMIAYALGDLLDQLDDPGEIDTDVAAENIAAYLRQRGAIE
jgi:hypothetical protein